MANKSSLSKEEVALSLSKIAIEKMTSSTVSKENIVDIYNYIYENLKVPSDEVVIIDDIPRKQ